MKKFVSELNSHQQQGVETTKGYLLLLAGAGSGKTRVLVHRISHLITQCHVSPSSILALTFTNKAAGEMKERIEKMIPSAQAKKLFLGTFHSFCMKLLRTEIHHLGFTSAFSLYDEKDMKRLMLQLGSELEGEESTLNKTLPHLLEAKREGLSIDQLPSIGSEEENLFFKKAYEKLLISLRAYNALDFDGLLFTTVRLFEQFPEVLARYQERYLYIMIDEYQDTNVIQYKIADLLAKKHRNLCVVGDDDQSIYGWRGASIQNILSFPATTTIKLEQNYRSTPEIVEVANQLIKHNKLRHDKRLIPIQKGGDKVEIFHAPTEENEVEGVIARLLALREKEKLRWKEIAILYRSNKLAHPFELSLMQTMWKSMGGWVRGIPYQVFGGIEFFERSEVKDLFAYLRAIINPLDQEALLRIINFPRRGISDQTLDLITKWNRKQKLSLFQVLEGIAYNKESFSSLREKISHQGLGGITSFVALLKEGKNLFDTRPPHEAASLFIEKIQYKKALFDEVKSEEAQQAKWEHVEESIIALQRIDPSSSLQEFLSDTLLGREQQKEKGKEGDYLNLVTFHSAKGLEFPACFIIGLEDHILPHEKCQTKEGIEEERRLLYVAITRAMRFLTLSMVRKREYRGKVVDTEPSRFLFELPKELLNVTSWRV